MTTAVRRTTPEVLREILRLGPASMTDIRFTVGLNHAQTRRYVPFLVAKGYLEGSPSERGGVKYGITPLGHKLLGLLNELSDLMEVTAE